MKKYQCYYNETIYFDKVKCTGKRINTECLNTEIEAEKYCNNHVGITEFSDGGYIENEMRYEEIDC